jgi:hypothetical protein
VYNGIVVRAEHVESRAMTRQITAVVEQGRLRPTVPLDLAEGTEVQIVILPAAPPVTDPEKMRRVKEAVAAIIALPMEGGPEFSGRDHDRILYGEGGAR